MGVGVDLELLVPTVVGGVLALAGGVVGSWLQGRAQQRMEQERRRERTAETLAEITVLLEEIDPNRFFFKFTNDNWLEAVEPFVRRHEALRMQLLALSSRHPESRVRDLAGRLEKRLLASVDSTWLYLQALQTEGEASMDEAQRDHAEVQRLLAELREAILVPRRARSGLLGRLLAGCGRLRVAGAVKADAEPFDEQGAPGDPVAAVEAADDERADPNRLGVWP